ncbi:GAI protein2C [Pyxidicoccus fallax]|uniref:GRAS family protein n=1 Tax=Pyxidicoccus fallax TaxID=394095 RepID=A0A848L587_9BACT|nr:GRAS family protein [Pyxidicoccus fallax]NMO13786.1 GRAS family protein [Pyxidicoccus fallax]NPC77027.1 GAI protein2C [Pyxidicoccus fallax]
MRTLKDELLLQGLEHALAGRQMEAVEVLRSLHALLDVRAVPEDLHYLLFATAISRRLEGAGVGPSNPYLHAALEQGPRQIDLFRLLVTHMPLASTADAVANAVLTGLLRGHGDATLLDVGIGQARQECGLLRELARAGALPRRLTLVGVEPSGPSLRQAEASVAEVAREVGASVRFVGLESPVEGLADATWEALRGVPRPLVVNAAFAMHHVADMPGGRGEARDAVLRRLCALAPKGLVLCEPHVDHHRAPVRERFRNAWNHFTRVFALLDTLDVPREDRAAIKRFFGREVDDIVGTVDEAARCERHETAPSWQDRLRRAGFVSLEAMEKVKPESVHPAVSLRRERGCVGICYQEDMLVAVLGARPAEGDG